MSVIKWFGKILLSAVIVVVVLVGALLLVNAVDEDLHPEVASALKPVQPATPEQENGFFVIAGFNAPAGEDPHEHGRRWLAEINAASTDQLRDGSIRYRAGRLDFEGMKGSYCWPVTESCFDKARRNPAEVRRLAEANAVLLQRYESLYRYSRIEEVIPVRVEAVLFFPVYSPIHIAQSLKLAQIALLMEAGRIADALDELERDLALHRKYAAGSSSLMNLFSAHRLLANDYLFLADALRSRRGELAPHADRIVAMSASPGLAEVGLGRVFDTEFRFVAAMLGVAKVGRSAELFGTDYRALDALLGDERFIVGPRVLHVLEPFMLPFLKERATINMLRSNYQRLAVLNQAPAGRLAEEYRVFVGQVRMEVFNWRLAYSPVGKLLVANMFEAGRMAGENPQYSSRLYDTEGLARLVALQVQIVQQGIPDSDIPRFLASSDKGFFDPYTGKPMQWDAAARQLWFEPRSSWAKHDKIGGREDRIAVGL